MTEDTNRIPLPPYIAFKTFLNLLTRLEEAVPRRIDRSYWGQYYGGTVGTLLMAGLRFLGLVEGQTNIPTQTLKRLVDEKESRKHLFAELLQERYAPIFTHIGDISTSTSGLLDEAFRQQYKLRDDTLRKAISFFVHAAQYAEIPVSKHIAEKTRTRTATTRSSTRSNGKRSRSSSSRSVNEPSPPPKTDTPYAASPQVNTISGNTKTVTFQKGGSVSLTYSVDLFNMDEDDRKFLLGLIDQLRHYEQGIGDDDYDEEEMEEEEE